MLYAISATVTRTTSRSEADWSSTRQLPTFFLDSNVQGILSASGAESVARRLLLDAAGEDAEVHVFAAPVEDWPGEEQVPAGDLWRKTLAELDALVDHLVARHGHDLDSIRNLSLNALKDLHAEALKTAAR